MTTPTQGSEIEVSRDRPADSPTALAPATIETPLAEGFPTAESTHSTPTAPLASPPSTNPLTDPTCTSPSQDPLAPTLNPTPVTAAPPVAPTSNAGPILVLPVQQAHSAQNTPAGTLSPAPTPIITPVAQNSSKITVPTPPKQQSYATQPSTKKSIQTKLWESKSLLFALAVVGFVDGLTLSAPSKTSLLGSISNTSGILVLSILSALTGYALLGAADTVWARVPYRMLAKKQSSGLNLIVFWTLAAGVGGSFLILWRELCKLRPRSSSSNTPNTSKLSDTHERIHDHPKLWSTLRVVSWIVVQFPGIIIMTIVNTKISYIPIQWTPIGGGIGRYDPKEVVPNAVPALITNSALSILQDTTRAVQVDPVSSDCIQAGDSCKAFLIPGGLQNVTPWPYQKLQDTTLDVYVTKGGPAYQLDFWSPPQNITWPGDQCSVYAANEDESFQLCTSLSADSKTIMTGWTPCTRTLLPSGECDQRQSWDAFNYTATFISISRRTATVYSKRDTSIIVAWEDLGTPEIQTITPSDFKIAFDVMVVPWNNSSFGLSSEDTVQLTAQIASTLVFDLAAPESTKSLDYLCNFFATPLYVFNPLLLGLSAAFTDIADIQPGLLAENYINGSYARTRDHAVPERWTVLVYVVISGVLLLGCFLGLFIGTGFEGTELSDFHFIDSLKLRWFTEERDGVEVEDMSDLFSGIDLADNLKVLERADGVRIKLKTGINCSI